jgi:hypothetical protein
MEITMRGVDGVRSGSGILSFLSGIVLRPRATLLALSTSQRSWWGVPAFLLIATLILSVAVYSYADCQYVHRLEMEQYTSSGSQAARPPEPPTPLPITMAIRAGGRSISQAVSWLAWSVVLYLIVVLLGESDVGFGSVWKLCMWSSMPYVVRGVLQSATMLLVRKPIYNQALSGLVVDHTPPPPMTFSYVIPTKNELILASILERLDIYLLWYTALLVIGLTTFTGFSRKKALGVTVGIWLAFMLIGTIPDFFPGTFARFRYF